MPEYAIRYTPERKRLRASRDHPTREEGEPIGHQIEGHTTFAFTPENSNYTEDDYIRLVEHILESCNYFTHGEDPDQPYCHVVYRKHDWSHYHLAVQADDRITLFVRVNTTEQSVEDFHNLLEQETGEEWVVNKYETDMNGAGPNRE